MVSVFDIKLVSKILSLHVGKMKNQAKANLFFLEGNIGVGKTSIFQELERMHPEWIFIPEPVEQWKNWTDGKNWLDEYYKNPKNNAFSFQQVVLDSYATLREPLDAMKTYICERSPRSATFVFAAVSELLGYLDRDELIFLENRYRAEFDFHDHCVEQTIYLRAHPDLCYRRIELRGRSEEKTISKHYVQQIHDFHEILFFSSKQQPVHVIDELRYPIPLVTKLGLVEAIITKSISRK